MPSNQCVLILDGSGHLSLSFCTVLFYFFICTRGSQTFSCQGPICFLLYTLTVTLTHIRSILFQTIILEFRISSVCDVMVTGLTAGLTTMPMMLLCNHPTLWRVRGLQSPAPASASYPGCWPERDFAAEFAA